MQSFLDEVVESLLKQHKSPEKLVLILPNKRAGIYLTRSMASALSNTVFAPRVLSIDSLMEEVSGLRFASRPHLLLELYKAYNSLPLAEKEAFHDFIKWANTLLQDFNDIDRHLVNTEMLFSTLESVYEIKTWYLKPNRTELIENYLQFWNSLGDCYRVFKETLAGDGLGYQGMVYRRATENVRDYLEEQGKQFIFIGFNALTTSESHLMQDFLASGKASAYWDIDQYFINDPIHDAGFFIRKYLANWPYYAGTKLNFSDHYSAQKNITVVGAPNNTSQAKYVGELLRKLVEEKSSLDSTAVILGDETLLNPLMNSIPPEISEVNITMGYPLEQTPAAGFFKQLFSLYAEKGRQGWYYKEILDLLSHPYLQSLLKAAGVQKGENVGAEIISRNLTYLSPLKIRTLFGDDDLCRHLFPDKPLNSSGFIQYCLDLIERLKEVFNEQDNTLSLEYLYGFYKIFNQLTEAVALNRFLEDLVSLQRFYEELLSRQTIDFKGEPLRGLQVMGMLESRNIDFETVIITSVNEGVLPAGKTYNSFIPYDIKKELKLPAYKEKDAVYTYHFYRLLQRAKHVVLLYNTEPDVLEGGEKSRLIMQLRTDPATAPYCNEIFVVPNPKPSFPPLQSVEKEIDILKILKEKAGTGLSPTVLSSYTKDPLEFYKKVVLNIGEEEEVEEDMAARTFGIIVHDVLEKLYKPTLGKTLTAEHLGRMKTIFPNLVEEAIKEQANIDRTRGKNLIAAEVILKYLDRFLDMEEAIIENQSIEIIALEEKLRMELNIPGLDFPVVLKGTIDRIDRKNGQLRVIDYKTGKVEETELKVYNWDLLKTESKFGKSLQLMCYALLVAENYPGETMECGIITFKSLSKGMIKFSRIPNPRSKRKNPNIDTEVLNSFREVLYELIAEIFNPGIPILEKETL